MSVKALTNSGNPGHIEGMSGARTTMKSIVSGLVCGFVNGLVGAAGGVVLLPLLEKWVRIDSKSANATTLLITLAASAISAGAYTAAGCVNAVEAAPYLPGAVAGAAVAGYLLKRLKYPFIRKIFGAIAIYAAASLFLKR